MRSTVFLCTIACVLSSRTARAKNPEQPETAPPVDENLTFIDHSGSQPFWFGAEINTIFQGKPGFSAKYNGPKSFSPNGETAVSGLMTVFTAYRPFKLTEIIFDMEMAMGGGLSDAVGIAGYTNLDVVRNPTLSHLPYVARLEVHQIIPLSSEWEVNDDRGPVSSMPMVPRHRLELRIGKLSTADLFDINPAGSDSHMQFMNWAVDNNGAYDYAADTRGYTYGMVIEYQGPRLEARFGEMLLPKVANGTDIQLDLSQAYSENMELEIKYLRRQKWRGTVRALAYVNSANMGVYKDAVNRYLAGITAKPDITDHPLQLRMKYGFGLNVVQELGGIARLFARGGWNDGHTETFAYTEIDDTFEIGADLLGTWFHRPFDRLGLAFVTNGISKDHQAYLKYGGQGFILGDGNLHYGRENIVETYYNIHIVRGVFAAGDVQIVQNPGYNQDRGPAWVFSLRGHLEF